MSIVQALRAVQEAYHCLPDDALLELAKRLGVKPYRLQEVASFFPHFHRDPAPAARLLVCRDMACHLARGPELLAALRATPHARDSQRLVVEPVSCLGRCDRAPVLCAERAGPTGERPGPSRVAARAALATDGEAPVFHFWAHCDSARACQLAAALLDPAGPLRPDTDQGYAANVNDWTIDVYATDSLPPYEAARRLAEGLQRDRALTARPAPSPDAARPKLKGSSYAQLKEFLERRYPSTVCRLLEQLDAAALRGMGGAGQAAFEKWLDVLTAPGDIRYVVANADESEPGTFKDRELLLRAPHLVIEGVILAGLLLGAERGYVYVRHEYAEGIARLHGAIRDAEAAGVCGRRVLDSERAFPVEVFVSPGGYICGEQSALLEAMEDRRAEPRNRPPELATNGLRERPTLVNNVETLAWVPAIALKGGAWYAGAAAGEKSKGRRLFSVSGDVARPGVYELPVGAPLRRLIEDCAGGMRDLKYALKAVAPSGPSGGFVPPLIKDRGGANQDLLDLKLDIDAFRQFDLMLGAGLVVYDATRDLLAQALNCTEFFRNESCGKCVPCRIGSQKLVQIGQGLLEGLPPAANLKAQEDLVERLAEAMEFSAICGLGMVAYKPLRSLLRHFPGEVRRPRAPGALVSPPEATRS
ncbi:MAG TPA: NAD(P)H-dependent oxidoreductase subunit E [Gemmataceae bacterium]|nr:NAD(P)H-dependent oxidoreductase subunit E [Gemmataceae bacterium]